MGGQHGQVLSGIGIALLALVARHEDRVKVFRARMRQFVQHPRLGHRPILNQQDRRRHRPSRR
jgi:hypothetical protein